MKKIRCLAIGNSFSEDATYYLYQIAKSAGIDEVVIRNLYIGGCSLATHWNNAKTGSKAYDYQKNTNGTWVHNKNTAMEVGIKDENWDVITLQQVSGLSGVASTYNSDLTNLIDFINSKKTNKSAKLVWHMTWAYQSDSTHTDFSRYNKNQLTMYNAIVNAVQEKIVTNSSFNLIIPAGTAIQNVRTSFVGDNLTRDGYHLTLDLGRYIAGLTWFKAITGLPVESVQFVPGNVAPRYLPMIHEAVNNAVSKPFKITQSSYTELPEVDLTKYKLLDWSPYVLGYWNSTNGGYDPNPTVHTNASNSVNFVTSKRRFTRGDIPVGSILVVDKGYQYRPEGWISRGVAAPGRPNTVSTNIVDVTEEWWGQFEYRAFNVSTTSNSNISSNYAEVAKHFRIYVPKSNKKDILSFKIGDTAGVIEGNKITVNLRKNIVLKNIEPSIVIISPFATIYPADLNVLDFSSPVELVVIAEDGSKKTYTVTVNIPGAPATTKNSPTASSPINSSAGSPINSTTSSPTDSHAGPSTVSSDLSSTDYSQSPSVVSSTREISVEKGKPNPVVVLLSIAASVALILGCGLIIKKIRAKH